MGKNEAPKIALRSISSLFSETWKRYRARWSVLVEILLLPTLVIVLGVVLVSLDVMFSRALGGVIMLVGWIIFAYSVLPIIYSIHNGAGVDASYQATIKWFWPYVWVAILTLFAVIGGFVMLIIPGIWLGIALTFMAYVFVIERRSGTDALRQSKEYVKGYWWAVFGRTLLLALIYLAVVAIVRIPLSLLGAKMLSGLVSAVLVLLFVPFSMIYHYLIFENLRERKPELLEAHTKKGAGFIKAGAIVGIVTVALLVIFAITLAPAGAFYMARHANFHYASPPGGYGQAPPIQQQ